LPIIREIEASGVKSRAGIAAALNVRKIATARGGSWSHVQVGLILDRAGKAAAPVTHKRLPIARPAEARAD